METVKPLNQPTAGRLIGLAGLAGSGKSEAARFFIKAGFEPVKFAGPLKAMLRAYFENVGVDDPYVTDEMLEGHLKEQPTRFLAGISPRHAMQTLGTEWGRNAMASDFWIKALKARVEPLLARGVDVVVDDVRFENEAAAIRSLKGTVVRVDRPGPTKITTNHVSESLAFLPDLVVLNDDTLETLRDRLSALF